MRLHLLISLSALAAVCACSSGGSSTTSGTNTGGSTGTSGTTSGSSGSSDAGFTSITFTTVDIHPAAVAALTAAGAPVPSIVGGGPYDAGYQLLIQGVAITAGAIQESTFTAIPITNTGPYTYAIYNTTLVQHAPLGVLAAVVAALPDGGVPAGAGDGGLPELPCNLVEGNGGVAAALTAAATQGLNDYLISSGSQVGGRAAPPANGATAVAYAVPMSYASMLNCAGSASKTTRDTDLGVALVYVTDGGSPATGNPISGASFSVAGANTTALNYYTGGNYTGEATSATDSTGVATVVNITLTGEVPGKINTTDPAGDTFFVAGAGTSSNSFFNALIYLQ
jgi:hypothetical protein